MHNYSHASLSMGVLIRVFLLTEYQSTDKFFASFHFLVKDFNTGA